MSANENNDLQPVYVYGVVPAEPSLLLADPGVAGERVELVAHDGIAALVSAFPADDPRVRRRDLVAHLETLERVFERTTVAPCPFGTVLGSRDDVEHLFLAERHDELQSLLARLEGHAQMNVKAEYDEEVVLRELVADNPDVAAERERAKAMGSAAYYENIRLGELVSARLAQRRAEDAERIAARLSALASATVEEPVNESELLVFKASFLVAQARFAEFDVALDELAEGESGRLRFEAIGPLPPTAFANLEAVGTWA
jgi:hypothetical protein